jgi:hypothetical protein
VVAAAISDTMLLQIDVRFVQEVQMPVHDGLAFPNYALLDSYPGSLLATEASYQFHFEGSLLLPLNDAAWLGHS